VLAAGAGQVSYAGLLAGRGVVVVQHGELRTTYEPVTAEVGVGQQVAADEPLGRLDAGHAGCPVVACLHWGLRRGEQYLDPLSLVGAGPVRLLPVLEQAAAPAAGTGRARSGPADPAPADPAPAAPEPAFDLRAATSPSGALAVAALLAGLALLARPRPPDRPAGGAASGTVHTGAPPSDPVVEPEHPGAQVHDLARERARRTAGGS
jgi:murein DD-endopeptidase MepM/ murein hydrolase activator NlpD